MSARAAGAAWTLAACLGALPSLAIEPPEIDAAAGERLEVELPSGGSLEVLGGPRNAVRVEPHGEAADSADLDLRVERTAVGVRVTARYRGQERWRGGVDLTIHVPRVFDLDLETSGGNVTVTGVEGNLGALTLGGELKLSELRGDVDFTTHGGNVEIEDCAIAGAVATRGGNVHVIGVVGALEVTTQGGNVVFENAEVSTADCRAVRIATMGGNIEAPDSPCGAVLETLGGNVVIGRAGDHVEASTLGGNIVIRAADGRVRASTLDGNVDVVVVEGRAGRDRDVRLTSQGGHVRLALPAGFSADFDVTLTYTKNSRRDYRIESDFPLELRSSPSWVYEDGGPRKYIYGSGTAGGGRNRIKIEATNGDVRIVRQDG